MRITYVAKHGNPFSNDDEGAIAYALSALGHEVTCIHERRSVTTLEQAADLVLFHKLEDVPLLVELGKRNTPRVFWYFDLVNWPDPSLEPRNLGRRQWMTRTLRHADLGFCTDGDWVNQDMTGKLVWLTQGADERLMPLRQTKPPRVRIPILFTGIGTKAGAGREAFVRDVMAKYGIMFKHVSRGVYGGKLKTITEAADVVLAPDCPVTDNYWSNRVYNALGFGAFLLHPYCSRLETQYPVDELQYYTDRESLFSLIDHYLRNEEDRTRRAIACYHRTAREHTYRHRCQTLLQTVKERLGVS